jgi:hypothetical protein
MTAQAFNVNKPGTWHLAATIDSELQEVSKQYP